MGGWPPEGARQAFVAVALQLGPAWGRHCLCMKQAVASIMNAHSFIPVQAGGCGHAPGPRAALLRLVAGRLLARAAGPSGPGAHCCAAALHCATPLACTLRAGGVAAAGGPRWPPPARRASSSPSPGTLWLCVRCLVHLNLDLPCMAPRLPGARRWRRARRCTPTGPPPGTSLAGCPKCSTSAWRAGTPRKLVGGRLAPWRPGGLLFLLGLGKARSAGRLVSCCPPAHPTPAFGVPARCPFSCPLQATRCAQS